MDRRFTGYAIAGALLASRLAVPAMAQPLAIQDEVSYTQDIQPLVREFCTTCHAGDDPEGDFVLTSYDDVRQHAEQGTLLARINDEEDPMPQTGLLPKSMRHLFQRWVDGGFVNEGHGKRARARPDYRPFTPPSIQPVDVNQRGFELLESMQGHWVGAMHLMGQDYDWMAFDYRAIAPSHVHGIFEGGTIGNLFTSFFVTDFEGTRTIMARNGGMLNGIYRTSYFVLDHVESGDDGTTYRLVDAYGGEGIMFMELTFHGDTLEFNSYTSRFGLTEPKLHMAFKAQRRHPELAAAAAAAVGFPKNVMAFDFSAGLPRPNWPAETPLTSASYIWEEKGKSLTELGQMARDPIRIDQMPYVSKLTIKIDRQELTQGKPLHVYLSRQPLTDQRGKFITHSGYVRSDLLDGLLSFPELGARQDTFTFTYLHPGRYSLTVVADMDGDGYPSPGDVSHPATEVHVAPKSEITVQVKHLDVRN